MSAIELLPDQMTMPDAVSLFDQGHDYLSRSLREFTRAAWSIIEPGRPFKPGWHIDAMTDHLEGITAGHITHLLINVPPRHMKSSLVSVLWPAWEWTTHPDRAWLFASYHEGLSTRDSVKMRRLIESDWYRWRWGSVYRLTGDQNLKTWYDTDKGGRRMATSVNGSSTGHGGDRLVVDDPHNVRNRDSDAVRLGVLDWFDHVWYTRVNDPATVAYVVIMQRLHEQDLSGHLLAPEPLADDVDQPIDVGVEVAPPEAWTHLCLPARYEGKTFVSGWTPPTAMAPIVDPRSVVGQPLWPEQFPSIALGRLERRLGSYGTAAQLQQRPAPAGGGILKREWWRHWRTLPERFDDFITSWDMTFKSQAQAATDVDYVVGQAWGFLGADAYLIDQVRGRWGFTETCRHLLAFVPRFPQARAHLVEDKANGPAVIDHLTHTVAGMLPVEPMGDKVSRVWAIQPRIEAGNVWLPDPTVYGFVGPLLDRCDLFPSTSEDDEIDAMTQAIIWQQLHRRLPVSLRQGAVQGWNPRTG